MFVIRAFHDPLDLQLIYNNIGICFCIRVAGMENVLFVFLIEAKLFQIVLSVEERDDKIALVCSLLTLHKNVIAGEDARADHALALGDQSEVISLFHQALRHADVLNEALLLFLAGPAGNRSEHLQRVDS